MSAAKAFDPPPLNPTPEQAAAWIDGALSPLDAGELDRRHKAAANLSLINGSLDRALAVAWLVGKGLACNLGDSPTAKAYAPPPPIPQGNPTLKYVNEKREAERPKSRPRLISTLIDDIEEEETEWLWPGRIPAGRLSVLMGRQGDGKSTLVTWLAATISSGGAWPDGGESCDPGSVLILQAEESAASDIRPRLNAFGFGRGFIRVISGVNRGEGEETSFNLSLDAQLLREEIELRGNVRLVIVDPLGSYIRGISGYNEAEVRDYLRPVKELAEETGVAVLLVAHPNKDKEKDVLDRMSGSGAFTQIARMSWYFSEDPRDTDRRFLSLMKGNLHGATTTGIALHYDRRKRLMTWFPEPVKLSARDVDHLLQKASRDAKLKTPKTGVDPVKGRKAREFLLALLASGPVLQQEAQERAEDDGVKESTFRRTLRSLIDTDGRVVRQRNLPDPRWWISLVEPPAGPPAPAAGGDTTPLFDPDSSALDAWLDDGGKMSLDPYDNSREDGATLAPAPHSNN